MHCCRLASLEADDETGFECTGVFFFFFLRQTPVEGKGLKQNRAERH